MFASPSDSVSTNGLDSFIRILINHITNDKSAAEVCDFAVSIGPTFMPEILVGMSDRNDADTVLRKMALEIYNNTPRPALNFSVRRFIPPGRNEPCFCGTGKKYKHCCSELEGVSLLPNVNVLPYVLDSMPRKNWASLVGSAIDPDCVAHAAQEMIDDKNVPAAITLLEPWFKNNQHITAKNEWMLDILLDAYSTEEKPRKKKLLLEQALQYGDRIIRSAAIQRLATISADEGDYEKAWHYFHQAQREHTDSVSLAHLEITLLVSQGSISQAQERARFWMLRIKRTNPNEFPELLEFLRNVAENGEQAFLDAQVKDWPELRSLVSLLTEAPTPKVQHQFNQGNAESTGPMTSTPELKKALVKWEKYFPQGKPMLTDTGFTDHPAWDDPDPWLNVLKKEPILWQSFDVLDDLILALTAIPVAGIFTTLRDPILARAELLFNQLIENSDAKHKMVEWGWHENRCALRLLAQQINIDLKQPSQLTIARAERFLKLNPNDNHGFRNPLIATYLLNKQFEQALQLSQIYPDDTQIQFSRVLALWALDQHDEALQCLQLAHSHLPLVLPMLLSKKTYKPRAQTDYITYGGKDQALLIREEQLPAWKATPGALEWLGKAKRELK